MCVYCWYKCVAGIYSPDVTTGYKQGSEGTCKSRKTSCKRFVTSICNAHRYYRSSIASTCSSRSRQRPRSLMDFTPELSKLHTQRRCSLRSKMPPMPPAQNSNGMLKRCFFYCSILLLELHNLDMVKIFIGCSCK